MLKRLLHFLLLFLLLIPFPGEAGVHSAIKKNESLLMRLDSIIANHDYYITRKEQRIADLRSSLRGNQTTAERLTTSRRLYEEYLVYDSDSALYYATETGRLAEMLEPDNSELALDCRINQAFIFAALGFFDEATEILDSIDPSRLSPTVKLNFFQVAEYVYSIRALYMQSNVAKQRENLDISDSYRDSLSLYGRQSDALWAPIARMVETDRYTPTPEEIDALKNVADHADSPTRQNAINNYWMARYYDNTDDDPNMIRYMTRAAIFDAEIENREIAAIQELAAWLFAHGDLNRAYSYLLYSNEQANRYNNRTRMVSLSNILPTVRDAYRKSLEEHQTIQRWFIIALGLLTLCFLILLGYTIRENSRLKRTRAELSRVNNELKTANDERQTAIVALETANGDLSQANTVKRGMILFAFRLATDYINALEEYRKKLLRKFKLKQFDDLGHIISDNSLIKEHYSDFYVAFDRTVLSIFPDFVEEFNASAPEENKVNADSIIKSQTLNTRLRIHALRRLGVEKSADIARMLNVSIRTVYNNRNTTSVDDENPPE